MKNEHAVYNLRFAMLCASSLLFSTSYNMLIPELPSYLSSLGESKHIGLIIALFTLTAGLSRPFSGILTDKIGRKPVMIFGAIVCVICGLFYPILGTVSGFLLLRLIHGFSTGFSPTAIVAYVADIVPKKHWGEAFGIQGLCFSTGLALGPAIGSTIKLYYSFDFLFHCSSLIAFLSIIFFLRLKETLTKKQRFELKLLRISKNDIISLEVLTPAIITFLSYSAFGMILTLIPDWSDHLGITNKGTFFIVFTISSLAIRFVAGKVSDKKGRKVVVMAGLSILFLSLVIMGYFDSPNGLLAGGVIYGLSMGILSPALNAWTVDLSSQEQRGKGVATMFIALEAGIGLGALFSGWYYGNFIENIPMAMFGCAGLALIGFLFLLSKPK
ncbi:MFS transporter [Zobellia nedashkovskayae]